jgi:hypothetical protein
LETVETKENEEEEEELQGNTVSQTTGNHQETQMANELEGLL